MNLRRFALFVLIALAFFTSHLCGQTAEQLATEGQRAYMSGDTQTAKEKFKLALEIDPKNVTARNYLRMIVTEEAKSGGGGQLAKQLQSLVLAKVEMHDAT